jgi:L-aspartate oxidase
MNTGNTFFDTIVVGTGIAGLSFSLKLSAYFRKHHPSFKICLITKADDEESNTKYAQGGVAVVSDFLKDSYEKHIEDTLIAGDNLSRREVVEMVIKTGPARIEEIIAWGTQFDKDEKGKYALGKEGGHSEFRVLHHKDITGLEIEKKLLKQVYDSENIIVLNHHFAIDLITQHHLKMYLPKNSPDIECYGLYVMNQKNNKISKLISKTTVLATGGLGQVYFNTSNPSIATGDGLAMVYRAGGLIENMEFIQFHPTGLFNPGERPSFLISEAVRGFGAVLKSMDDEDFMLQYDARGSLASRDIVARAIDFEMKKRGDDHVFLDCRHIPEEKFKNRFPRIYRKCLSIGIDPSHRMIPVMPTAHYACGGILSDLQGRSSIKNLYAIGECASTGLHGANRLASNSLLEALVFAHNSYEHCASVIGDLKFRQGIPEWNAEGTIIPREKIHITHMTKELQVLMSDYVSIVKSNRRLEKALKRLKMLNEECESLYNMETLSPQLCELRNLICVGYLISKAASERKENKGLHYNIDLAD